MTRLTYELLREDRPELGLETWWMLTEQEKRNLELYTPVMLIVQMSEMIMRGDRRHTYTFGGKNLQPNAYRG